MITHQVLLAQCNRLHGLFAQLLFLGDIPLEGVPLQRVGIGRHLHRHTQGQMVTGALHPERSSVAHIATHRSES